jgi:hypothetical protein
MDEVLLPYDDTKFLQFRTGTIVFSAGENIGDLVILIGRHDTIQHSCILVWLDKEALREHKLKVHPHFIDNETTKLSFLGLAEGRKIDVLTDELQKGLILWEPEELFLNAPIVYTRSLNEQYVTNEYVCDVMTRYIETHHLKLKYLYGLKHIVTIGLGIDVFGEQKQGVLCSGNIYMFLNELCGFPDFDIDKINKYYLENKVLDSNGSVKQIKDYHEYFMPDANQHMFVPDFFISEYNTHPVMEQFESRVIGSKNENDVTVNHPFLLTLVVLILIVIFFFWLISNYCESCASKNKPCMINKDFFDLL